MKLFLIAMMALISLTSNAGIKPVVERKLNVNIRPVLKYVPKSSRIVNEPVYYQWELMNDGCYHLFSVTVEWLSPSNQWIIIHTPMNYTNYVGNTVMCMSMTLFDTMC